MEKPKITTINVPLYIPTQLVEGGAVELFASKKAGWTPTIEETVTAEDGTISTKEVQNPVKPLDACFTFIRQIVKEMFEEIVSEQGAEQGKQQALEQFNSLFPKE